MSSEDSVPGDSGDSASVKGRQESPTAERPAVKGRLASEQVIINAPMSFAGAAQRAWRIGYGLSGAARIAVIAFVIVPVLIVWWGAVLMWYVLFSVLLVPYRLLRRGARKRKAEALRHREMLGALDATRGREEK